MVIFAVLISASLFPKEVTESKRERHSESVQGKEGKGQHDEETNRSASSHQRTGTERASVSYRMEGAPVFCKRDFFPLNISFQQLGFFSACFEKLCDFSLQLLICLLYAHHF